MLSRRRLPLLLLGRIVLFPLFLLNGWLCFNLRPIHFDRRLDAKPTLVAHAFLLFWFLRLLLLLCWFRLVFGVLLVVVDCKHVVVFYAVLEHGNGHLSAKHILLSLAPVQLCLDEVFDVGSETLLEGHVHLGVALVLVKAEDVVDEGESHVDVPLLDDRAQLGRLRVEVLVLALQEVLVVVEEPVELGQIFGRFLLVPHHSLIFITQLIPSQMGPQHNRDGESDDLFELQLMSDNISFSSNRSSIQKFKIVLVGDQNVGKSSIIARYIRNEFDPTKNPTIGIDFISKNIATGGKIIRLQLWDTAGQERFKSLIPSYLKDAHMALVVYDLSNPASVESIPKWIDFVREAGKKDIRVYLIGNKSDLDGQIAADTRNTAKEIAEKQTEHYQEVSAKTGSNIEDLFNLIIDDLLSTSNKKKEEPTQASVEGDKKSEAGKEESKTIKLGQAGGKPAAGGNQWANCCQK